MITNKLSVVGTLTKDSITTSGIKDGNPWTKCQINIVVVTDLKGKMESYSEKVYLDCNLWNEQATKYSNLKEGDKVSVTGRFKMESWIDKEGNKKSKPVIVPSEISVVSRGSETKREASSTYVDELPF